MQYAVRQHRDRPWGFWPTLGFGAAIATVFIFVQVLTAFAYLLATQQTVVGPVTQERFESLETNGAYFTIATILSAIICSSLVFLFVRLKPGCRVRSYLGLTFPGIKVFLRWLLLIVVIVILFDGLMILFGKPRIPEFILESYRSAGFLPLFWFAIAVAAPFFEELFFRGFLYAGLAASRLGVWGAIVVTSLIWSVVHLQYDTFLITLIFVAGLILGYARHKTRSLVPCIAMHMLFNLIALIEVAVYLQLGEG